VSPGKNDVGVVNGKPTPLIKYVWYPRKKRIPGVRLKFVFLPLPK
jgi:hypothetical protein